MLTDLPELKLPKVDPTWKVAIVRSVWHGDLTEKLAHDAKAVLVQAGMKEKNISIIDAPGSFEVPLFAKHAIVKKKVKGVIAFGVIVQGATHHARLLADTTAQALMDLQMQTTTPVTFEVLFVRDIADARARAIGAGAKGGLAARTLLTTLAKLKEMR